MQYNFDIYFEGYGAPDFLNLHATSRTHVINSVNLANLQAPTDLFFFHDAIADSMQTTPTTPMEAIESGDEGIQRTIHPDYNSQDALL
jgi:hypothetical protein